ncbi:MAG: TatD family hydrolase [Candidatus Kapaibacterium sp.]
MIDTHAHIDSEQFDTDRPEMIERAFAAGVEAIIIPSIGPEGFGNVQAIVDSDPRIYRGIGIHPHNANDATRDNLERVERESTNTRVVAIGEIGLDYYYDFAPKDVQKAAFRAQLHIAKRRNLPVIIHNRESDEDILSILREEQDGTLQFVLHCFSSSVDVLHRALDLGAHVSFTGNITYKKSTLADVILQTPPDKIMIETDAPYMAPVPHRGKRNEPSFVGLVAQKIAEIHTLSLEKVYSMTSQTARSFFRLGLGILMLGFLLSTVTPYSIWAQSRSSSRTTDDRTDEAEVEEVEPANPYSRTLGIGLMMGTNTIVESIECLATGKRESRSYEGILLYGIAAEYCLTDHIQFEGSYVYSINHKVVEENPGLGYSPNLHQFITLTARFVANPRKPICFFATGGSSIILNRIFDAHSTQNAFNFGIGLYGNIPSNYGIIVPTAELKFDFPLQSNQYNDVKCGGLPADVGRFYSLVRLGVQWYPKF